MGGTTTRAIWTLLLILAVGGSIAAAAPSPAHAAAEGAAEGADFDALVADAKASMLADPQKAIARAVAAESAARALSGRRRTLALATAQWLQGEAYLRTDQTDIAAPLIGRALRAVQSGAPTKLTGDLLLSQGGLDTARADVAAALSDYQKAHNLFRDIGETRSQAIALLSIASLYRLAKDDETALKYLGRALDVYNADPNLMVSIYNNRGNSFNELARYAEAESEFRKALTLAQGMKSPMLIAQILRNIARQQIAAGALDQADRTVAEGMALARQQDAPAMLTPLWAVSAQIALNRGDIRSAQNLIDRAFVGVDLSKTTLAMRDAHETAYAIYRRADRAADALLHLVTLKRLDDQTTKLATSTNTALMAARFDSANQETRIANLKANELQRNIDFERAQARTQQFIFIGAAGVTLVIVVMLGVGLITIRRSRNEVRAANIDLARTNSALGKALAAKTEFLATTSHEIRTPLNGILGMTQVMLADRTMDPATRDRVGVVYSAGVMMRALVDDILDVAKMETGNMTIEHVPFDLKATMTDVTRMWEEQARARGIAFTLDLANAPAHIAGDAARLRQIVFNMLSNALKFTEKGAVEVRVSVDEGAKPELRIAISDTGIGIRDDQCELIFESFRQGDSGTTRKFGGTGLGLSICRNLARAMHGDVRVASNGGAGSTFTLALPLVLAGLSDVAALTPNSTTHGLLIVDRNPITRSMLRAILAPRAGSVVFAGSAEEALEQLASGPITRVLIDDATVKSSEDMDALLNSIATAAKKCGAQTAILWPAPDDATQDRLTGAGIDMIIAKPIAGAALAERLFSAEICGKSTGSSLVSQAA